MVRVRIRRHAKTCRISTGQHNATRQNTEGFPLATEVKRPGHVVEVQMKRAGGCPVAISEERETTTTGAVIEVKPREYEIY